MSRNKMKPTIIVTKEQIKAAEEQIIEQSKRIDFYLTDYSVELLAMKMENQDFEIPGYQREDTWEPERKSRFVESLLMGLAIPFLFFWEQPKSGKLEIVDGSQRLRTIHQFLKSTLVIGELQVLTHLEGMRFCDLPESRQRKIKNRSIRGIVLNEHADEQARFDIFERINTGSKNANTAEVRRGALTGPFLELVIDLAKNSEFVELAPMSQMAVNMRQREELVTRFFAFGDGLQDYRDRPAEFMFAYTKKMNSEFAANPKLKEQYTKRFLETMRFAKRAFPFGFRKSETAKEVPKTRYEALAIGSYLALSKRPSLAKTTPEVEWLEESEFLTLTKSGGSNPIKALRNRLEFVRDKLLEAGV